MDLKELEAKLAEMTAAKEAAEAKTNELAAANEALNTAVADKEAQLSESYDKLNDAYSQLNTAQDELSIARAKAFDENLNAVLDVSKLSDASKSFAMEEFQECDPKSSEDFQEKALMFKEIGAAVLISGKPDDESGDSGGASDLDNGAANVGAGETATIAESEALAGDPSSGEPVVAAEPLAENETASVASDGTPLVNLASRGAKAGSPQWSHRHL